MSTTNIKFFKQAIIDRLEQLSDINYKNMIANGFWDIKDGFPSRNFLTARVLCLSELFEAVENVRNNDTALDIERESVARNNTFKMFSLARSQYEEGDDFEWTFESIFALLHCYDIGGNDYKTRLSNNVGSQIKEIYNNTFKNNVWEELGDFLIRLLDIMGHINSFLKSYEKDYMSGYDTVKQSIDSNSDYSLFVAYGLQSNSFIDDKNSVYNFIAKLDFIIYDIANALRYGCGDTQSLKTLSEVFSDLDYVMQNVDAYHNNTIKTEEQQKQNIPTKHYTVAYTYKKNLENIYKQSVELFCEMNPQIPFILLSKILVNGCRPYKHGKTA